MAQRIAVTPRGGRLAPNYAKNYDADVPASLDYPAVSLHALLDQSAELYPDSTATIFFNAKKSYRSLFKDAKRFAAGLRSLGVKQGDKVAIDLPNCPQFLVAFFGALRIGAVVVPCNPLYTPPELRQQLADAGAETIVVLSRIYPAVKAAREGTKLRNVIVTNIKEEMPPVLRTLFTLAKEKKEGHRQPFAGDPGAIAFQKVLALGGDDSAAEVDPDEVALLQYTGGTTGTSKAAMLSHRAIVACISGSAPLMTETARRFRELTGANLVEGYGLTEASPVTHCNPVFDTAKNRIGTIGLTFPDTESRLVDIETGEREVAPGEAGELVIRGPQLMDGYYNQPQETAQTLRDGWLHTGDIATIDADGYVAIVDRKKEMIIVSGYNVYPREVEEALAKHPAVLEAAAIGVPHEIKGEA